ncbi:tripartite motif-containing protein 42-like [Pelobates fuscus]|uniref:tripartite motif-containing protein 42-like n=1 Tax=Pelobates fuscus TaxID=191477 RepID=UPI002FE4C7CE
MPCIWTCCGAPCCRNCHDFDCVCCPGKCKCSGRRRGNKPAKCVTACCVCHCHPRHHCENCICEYREQEKCPGYFCLTLTYPLCICKKRKSRCRCCQPMPRGIVEKKKKEIPISEELKNAIIQQLRCPSCKNMFYNPFILPCGHCLCQRCVDKIKTKDQKSRGYYFVVTCPVCEIAHYFSGKEQIRLPENYLRAKVALKYKHLFKGPAGIVLCERCPSDHQAEAVMRCTVCKMNYCRKCLSFFHNKKEFEEHILTDQFWEEEKIQTCFYHPLMPIVEYCMTDRSLLCKQCKFTYHEKHRCLPLTEASIKEAHTLFTSLTKFKRAKCKFENDLIEINLVNDNFRGFKGDKIHEIRDGFLKLHEILTLQETDILNSIQSIESKKDFQLTQFLSSSNQMLMTLEGIVQYSKEALQEENPITFLQSVNDLVKEIYNEVARLYQPVSSLKYDPIKNLQINFEEIASGLRALFPQPNVLMQLKDDLKRQPYIAEEEEKIEKTYFIPLVASKSSINLTSNDDNLNNKNKFVKTADENYQERPKSTPPMLRHPTNKEDKITCTENDMIDSSSFKDMLPRFPPSPVSIYQSLAYPNVVKLFWTAPPEIVDWYDVEFQEITNSDWSGSQHFGDLTGKINGIKRQSIELHNLAPNTELLFRVRGVNLAGEGEWCEIIKILTPVSDYRDSQTVKQKVRSAFGKS